MKILIIDDETIVRLGMRYAIPWEQHGYEVIGEASNGFEALELARKYKPDIVLTDIVMPEMDGLDFIEKIKHELPFSKFIIFSCHDDAEFYRKAIKLGVSEYIQKSCLTPQEILQAVNNISEEIRLEQIKRNEFAKDKIVEGKDNDKEEFINFIVHGKTDPRQNFYKYLIKHDISLENKYAFIMIIKADYADITYEQEYEGKYDLSIINISKNIFDNSEIVNSHIITNDKGNFIAFIVFEQHIQLLQIKEYLKDICYRIKENINQMFGLTITFGISNEINDAMDLHKGYENALDVMKNYYTHGLGNTYFYSDVNDVIDAQVNNLNEVYKLISRENEKIHKIVSLIENDKIFESLLNIEELAMSCYGISSKYLKSVYMEIIYHIKNILRNEDINIADIMGDSFNPIEYIDNPKTLKELNNKMITLLSNIRDYYLNKIKGKEKTIISLINNYINEHINEHITLENISSVVHLNTSYMSRFYKKETGINIKDYIISAKIEKSKELIISGYNTSQIIDKIGFCSESHFFKIFKKYTGITPKQFKELIKQKL